MRYTTIFLILFSLVLVGFVTYSILSPNAIAQKSGSCVNSCGDKSPDDCYCDELSLTKYKDYCEDIQTACPDIYAKAPIVAPVVTSSCVGYCGQSPNDGTCWCDTSCVKYGDCCSDYYKICAKEGDKPDLSILGNIYTKGHPSYSPILVVNVPSYFKADIFNSGKVDVLVGYMIEVEDGYVNITNPGNEILEAKSNMSMEGFVTFTSKGTKMFKIILDPNNVIDESNEYNNIYTQAITVIDKPPGWLTCLQYLKGLKCEKVP